MSGVGFFWKDKTDHCPDLVIENGQIKFDQGLETSVLISAFSDRFVELDQLPAGTDDQKGWWADLISDIIGDKIGSEIWRLTRAKTSAQTASFLEGAMQDMLQWMIDDGIASKIVVTSRVIDNQQIDGLAQIFRPSGDDIPFKFAWDGQELKISEAS